MTWDGFSSILWRVASSSLVWEVLMSSIALLVWLLAALSWLIKYQTTRPDYVAAEDEEFVEWWQRLGSRSRQERSADRPEY